MWCLGLGVGWGLVLLQVAGCYDLKNWRPSWKPASGPSPLATTVLSSRMLQGIQNQVVSQSIFESSYENLKSRPKIICLIIQAGFTIKWYNATHGVQLQTRHRSDNIVHYCICIDACVWWLINTFKITQFWLAKKEIRGKTFWIKFWWLKLVINKLLCCSNE